MKISRPLPCASLLTLLAAILFSACAHTPPANPPANSTTAPAPTALALTPAQAAAHVGQFATVSGQVLSADYRPGNDNSPTFLDFGALYPAPLFIAIVWGPDRPKFGALETTYNGKTISITGTITTYHGKPAIVVTDPAQIKILP
jgi:hypothetical protein